MAKDPFFDYTPKESRSRIYADTSYGNQELRHMDSSTRLQQIHKKDAYRGPVCPTCNLEIAPAAEKVVINSSKHALILLGEPTTTYHKECM